MAEEPKHAYDRLEPGVQAIPLGGEAVAAAMSAAISLKRIADALDKVAPGGTLDPNFMWDAAYQAGQAFERGRR